MREVQELLRRLGLTERYVGFFYTACAVELCMDQPERLMFVTKWIYPDVAKRYQTNWTAVERSIRTVRGMLWKNNRQGLEFLVGRPLTEKPGAAQYLAMLAEGTARRASE